MLRFGCQKEPEITKGWHGGTVHLWNLVRLLFHCRQHKLKIFIVLLFFLLKCISSVNIQPFQHSDLQHVPKKLGWEQQRDSKESEILKQEALIPNGGCQLMSIKVIQYKSYTSGSL